MTKGPIDLVHQVAQILDDLTIPYALGGSMASSLFGEPRSTVDVDIAIRLAAHQEADLLERVEAEFYVPIDAARAAIRARTAFNLVDVAAGLKVDLFVLGEGFLDRSQIDRRILVSMPGSGHGIWVTSPEVQVLRKLDWYRAGGGISDRQWRDVLGILNTTPLDTDYIRQAADEIGLGALLRRALDETARDHS